MWAMGLLLARCRIATGFRTGLTLPGSGITLAVSRETGPQHPRDDGFALLPAEARIASVRCDRPARHRSHSGQSGRGRRGCAPGLILLQKH